MIIKLNEDTGDTCGCDGKVMQSHLLKVNLDRTEIRYETLDGARHIVVPVVMLRSSVVMNSVLVPMEEVYPISWNGVPVTVHHPQNDGGQYISANSPEVVEDWTVGRIFNARLDSGALKAEAWINIDKANTLDPTLVPMIEGNTDMDVSTGFFSNDTEATGSMGGRAFTSIARNLNPDHLALLPGGTGACSWEDGCGLRANERKDPNMADDATEEKVSVSTFAKILELVGIKHNSEELNANRRGDDADYRQMVADLISNDASPFVPEDEDSLRMMSYATLTSMRDAFVPGGKKADEDVKDNNQKEADVADKDFVTKAELGDIIANALNAALPAALKANTVAPTLSDEDKAALTAAKSIVANARATRVDHIKANTQMTDEELATFSDAQLELMASRIKTPVADYAGRGLVGNFNEAEEGDDAAAAMTVDHVNNFIKANADKKAVH